MIRAPGFYCSYQITNGLSGRFFDIYILLNKCTCNTFQYRFGNHAFVVLSFKVLELYPNLSVSSILFYSRKYPVLTLRYIGANFKIGAFVISCRIRPDRTETVERVIVIGGRTNIATRPTVIRTCCYNLRVT